jgi:hypothetical protein
MKHGTAILAAAALVLGGCATTYQLTLMPRNSGNLYYGTATDSNSSEGAISITAEGVTYNGTWVQVTPERTTGYVGGGAGWGGGWGGGGRWVGGGGGWVSVDNPYGGRSTALLRSADGRGLRCDFVGSAQGYGGGTCRDDKGLIYDVQIRSVATESK